MNIGHGGFEVGYFTGFSEEEGNLDFLVFKVELGGY